MSSTTPTSIVCSSEDDDFESPETPPPPPPPPPPNRQSLGSLLMTNQHTNEEDYQVTREEEDYQGSLTERRLAREIDELTATIEDWRRDRRRLLELVGAAEAKLEVALRETAAAEDRERDAVQRANDAEDEAHRLRAEVDVWRRDHAQVKAKLEALLKKESWRPRPRTTESKSRSSSLGPPPVVRTEPTEPVVTSRRRRPPAALLEAKPFATEMDATVDPARHDIDTQLMRLNIEKDHLLSELQKFPPHLKTTALRDRKIAAENRLQRIHADTARLKSRLRDSSSLW